MKRICLWTNDVETTSIWHNKLRDETGELVLREGMPALLDVYEQFGVKSTFYFTGYIAKLYPDVVKMVVPRGHEVASHGFSHKDEHAFDVLSYKDQVDQLKRSKDLLEQLSGQEVISFRAPALRVNEDTPRALLETGYKIDSSVASQRFDMFLSYGSKKKAGRMFAPRLPYETAPDNLFKKGEGGLVEVPLTALGFPYLGTTMRIFPWITAMQRVMINLENGMNQKPVVFDIHPNEFLEEQTEEKRVINRRATNPIKYLLADVLRSKLKVRHLGKPAVKLYQREIGFFDRKGYQHLTVKDYCRQMGFAV